MVGVGGWVGIVKEERRRDGRNGLLGRGGKKRRRNENMGRRRDGGRRDNRFDREDVKKRDLIVVGTKYWESDEKQRVPVLTSEIRGDAWGSDHGWCCEELWVHTEQWDLPQEMVSGAS
ncbi:hypothetical protein F0562_028902 [Nyssa sinensis]|uniref:Uncharacterized protein n=1 Tax=Nyssa sinensis TaxID=561372 RepID=A0A5J5B1B7_9ASTE|nr:hypothetical protein F0562_028902 [Nyssa sinensis]